MGVGNSEVVDWWQNPTTEKLRGRFFGLFNGIVMDRADPKRLGRVRIFCPSIMAGRASEKDKWLPWARLKGAALAVPPLGAPVSVSFELGQIQHPHYEWGWIKGTDAATSSAPLAGKEEDDPTWKAQLRNDAEGMGNTAEIGATITADDATEAKPVYPYNKVFESEGGVILELDDSPDAKRLRVYHPSGTSVLIDKDGNVHIRSEGAIFNESKGDYVINLGVGATFKVVYPNGTSMALGASGFTVRGHAVTLMNRMVRFNGGAI